MRKIFCDICSKDMTHEENTRRIPFHNRDVYIDKPSEILNRNYLDRRVLEVCWKCIANKLQELD